MAAARRPNSLDGVISDMNIAVGNLGVAIDIESEKRGYKDSPLTNKHKKVLRGILHALVRVVDKFSDIPTPAAPVFPSSACPTLSRKY